MRAERLAQRELGELATRRIASVEACSVSRASVGALREERVGFADVLEVLKRRALEPRGRVLRVFEPESARESVLWEMPASPLRRIRRYLGSAGPDKMREVCRAVAVALGCD